MPNKITLYYAEWCPHCKNFMPEWGNLESIIDKKKLDIVAKKYEEEEMDDSMKAIASEGFPTIIINKNGKDINYTKGRTAKDILKEFGISVDNDKNDKKPITVTFYKLTHCGPCNRFQVNWDKLKELVKKEDKITLVSKDASELPTGEKEMFPAILITFDGKTTRHDGEREAEAFYKIIKDIQAGKEQVGGGIDFAYKYYKYKSKYYALKAKVDNNNNKD